MAYLSNLTLHICVYYAHTYKPHYKRMYISLHRYFILHKNKSNEISFNLVQCNDHNSHFHINNT